MARVEINPDRLSERTNSLRQVLAPLSSVANGPALERKFSPGRCIIAAHDGSPPASDVKAWRFGTVARNVRASYFEVWLESDKRKFCLERAYLTLFKMDSVNQEEAEFLCMHCDPNEPDSAAHAIYKQGPHLHVVAAEVPFPRAHLALNRGHLDVVLQSCENLTRAIKLSAQMLRDEVLDAIE